MILKNRTIFISLITFCMLSNVYMVSRYIDQKNQLKESYNKIVSYNNKYDLLVNSITKNLTWKNEIEGTFFEGEKDIARQSKLFYKLNNRVCNACIENISSLLKHNSCYFEKNKVAIISNFTSDAEMQFYRKEYFPLIINLKTGNKLDDEHISYFFTIDSETRIRNVFIPDKNFPFLTDLYLKKVLKCP